MKISLDSLASDVAALLGESLQLECQPEESPFPTIKEQVRIRAPAILSELLSECSPEFLYGYGKQINSKAEKDDSGVVTLELPDDFLRIIYLQMSDWARPVTEISSHKSSEALKQSSRWKGIKGTPQRPVAIFGFTSTGKRCLRLYSSNADATLVQAQYMPVPKADADDMINIPQSLYPILLNKLLCALHPS